MAGRQRQHHLAGPDPAAPRRHLLRPAGAGLTRRHPLQRRDGRGLPRPGGRRRQRRPGAPAGLSCGTAADNLHTGPLALSMSAPDPAPRPASEPAAAEAPPALPPLIIPATSTTCASSAGWPSARWRCTATPSGACTPSAPTKGWTSPPCAPTTCAAGPPACTHKGWGHAASPSPWRAGAGLYKWLGREGLVRLNPGRGHQAGPRPQAPPQGPAVDQAVALASRPACRPQRHGRLAPPPPPGPPVKGPRLQARDHAMIELLYSSGLRSAGTAGPGRQAGPRAAGWIEPARWQSPCARAKAASAAPCPSAAPP